MTDKSMGILLMVTFGISGAGVTALAWLFPALHLDKIEATLAGLIGLGLQFSRVSGLNIQMIPQRNSSP